MSTPYAADPAEAENYDLRYVEVQVRLINHVLSQYGPPARVQVIAAGMFAADLAGQQANAVSDDVGNAIPKYLEYLNLLTALAALAFALEQPKDSRGYALKDDNIGEAAMAIGEMLLSCLNGTDEARSPEEATLRVIPGNGDSRLLPTTDVLTHVDDEEA